MPLPIIELSEMIQTDAGIMARLISEFRERCDRRLRQKWRNKPRKFSDVAGAFPFPARRMSRSSSLVFGLRPATAPRLLVSPAVVQLTIA
ncbi:hypothetical protein WM11_23105 [Burkholderia ubonensis]|nr:hypothetical protein WI81_26500 [Burkholderia ubonensis]KWI98136.1 hypothetical protein WM11_23105 [Burkholderia ubonensis]KWI98859.1 hypothetical protein WM10_03260 [Burkholderia ubonensis]KWK18699.1 hypothetical protein WM12_01760 [Burkholderia ubonensis]KWK45033.1 hypothetical protein WM13_08660 [Burkholderia ubonensis]